MARPVTVTLDHDKSIEELHRRLDETMDELLATKGLQMGLSVKRHWDADTLHLDARVMFQRVTGTVELFPRHVRITVVLPDLLAGMAEKVTRQIEKRGAKVLEDKSPRST